MVDRDSSLYQSNYAAMQSSLERLRAEHLGGLARLLSALPVARDEQIKVKLDSADPKPSEQAELNQLEWKLTLDKGAKRTIRFDYTVEYPRSMDVVGLP